MRNILSWIWSIFCGLVAFACLFNLPVSWGGLLFFIPAILFNPKVVQALRDRNIQCKLPVYLVSSILPFCIAIGVSAAYSPSQTHVINSTNSSSIISTNLAESSSSTSSIVQSSDAGSSKVSSKPVMVSSINSGAKLKAHYIDVGQGDSEFLELPNGQTMLIDAGNPENGSEIVSYIKGLGHNKIDYLVATHPHSDHIGGMATVVNGLNIGSVYMPKKSTNMKTFEDLLTTIQSKGLKINTAKAGVNILKTGNLNIDILAPVNITGDDLNQYSAVIKVTYGANKFLFMGDAGQPSEEQITADVNADVLKVGHHGSNTATSQAFLNKVHPKYAVIEVGKGNSYGHPTAVTLQKLQAIGATIYRTDTEGTIIFTSDAKTITIDKKASPVKQQAPPVSSISSQASKIIVTPQPKASDNQSVTVYITKTGKKYHRDGCRYLKKSQIAISLQEAESEGYEPCSVCDPPQ